jgi:CRP-like cAMP-binding protein
MMVLFIVYFILGKISLITSHKNATNATFHKIIVSLPLNMDVTTLSKTPLFASVQDAEVEKIFSELSITETYLGKGEILAFQDEVCNRLIILLQGSVKAEMTDPSGKVVKIEDVHAPNPLAILFLFGANNRFPVQVTTLEEVAALVIPKQLVLRILGMNKMLLKNYLDISADFASRLSKKLHFMSFRTIRQKLAMYIIELSNANKNNCVALDKTKSALAEYFGVSRQALEREFTNMQNDGLLIADKRKITITDKNRLIRIVHF